MKYNIFKCISIVCITVQIENIETIFNKKILSVTQRSSFLHQINNIFNFAQNEIFSSRSCHINVNIKYTNTYITREQYCRGIRAELKVCNYRVISLDLCDTCEMGFPAASNMPMRNVFRTDGQVRYFLSVGL